MQLQTEPIVAAGRVTITVVTPDRPGSGNAQVELSCGHTVHVAGLPPMRYVAGDQYDCMTCSSDQWEREHPPLPDEQIAAIEATLPRCPECAGLIDKIPFIRRTVHRLDLQIDRQDGDVLASSEHYDSLEEDPEWRDHRYDPDSRTHRGTLEVECADHHRWLEARLAYRYDYHLGEHAWLICPAEVAVP